jgi:predicted metal-binding protein
MDLMTQSPKEADFGFLIDAAKKPGAAQAKILPATRVFVEDRVPLKCRGGCIG